MKNKQFLYAASALIIIILFFVASSFYKSHQKESLSFIAKENNKIFVRDHSPRYGNPDAKVFLIEFLDPECETCRALYLQVKSLLKQFGDKVQLVVRYAPFHRNSQVAIRALEAARLQGKYWEALEMLFHYQPFWGDHHNPKPGLIFEYLPKLGIDIEKLKKDMNSPKITEIIKQDFADLKTLHVRATPTFFVNGKPLEKFGLQHLRDLIASEVQLHY
jgi:protein-disulfide isomerase